MKNVQKMDLLFAVYIFCIVTTELMGIKTFPIAQFSWLHLNASVAILLFPIIFTINDVVVEVHGRERARSFMRSGLLVVVLTFLFAAIATALLPSARFAGSEAAFDKVFQSTLRISAANLVAFALAQVTDLVVFTRIRKRLGKKSLWLRNNVSNFAAQLLDTTVFISLAFYSLDQSFGSNSTFLVGLIVPYWLLKCFMSVVETPFAYLGVKWLKEDK